ncbi:terpene synthase family protein [Streptomyces sp. NPDC005538]|uniref:terpene synthase family protein n=1 Tax=Streptomyces sp. NPDC005538 TaxID=3157043 RepID=UPI0033A3E621
MTHHDTSNGVLPMPELTNSFPGPFPVSPHADRVEEQTLSWLGAFSLPAQADTARLLCNIAAQGVARAVPAADQDSLVLCSELFVWLTLFDDIHGEATAGRGPGLLADQVEKLTRVLDASVSPDPKNPFELALRDLLGRLQGRATPTQYVRLIQHLRGNLLGIVREAQQMIRPERMTVYDYCALRPDTVFVRTLMTTAEVLLQYELSDELRTFQPVRVLETAVSDLAGWINDLASYRREAAQLRANPLSLPALIMAEHGVALPVAFQIVSRMCEEEASTARARMTELSASGHIPLMLHAQALEHVAHSFIWHIDHARYRP